MEKLLKKQAFEYHSEGRPGKIEVVPTKPYSTQKDLSLAYTPGVAYPCLAIEENPHDIYKYTNKGNLVAVISNGTAVLGLGNIEKLVIYRENRNYNKKKTNYSLTNVRYNINFI